MHGKVDKKLVVDAENVNKNDVFSDRIKCTVGINGTPNIFHMVRLVQCTVLIGPVKTSVIFVAECCHCVFAFACQQLRLRTYTNCTIFYHVMKS